MTVGDYLTKLDELDVVLWNPGVTLTGNVAPSIRITDGTPEDWVAQLDQLLATPDGQAIKGLVVGQWSEEQFDEGSEPIVEALVERADKLTKLRYLFLGDIVFEECEISWLHQSDLSPIFSAFPELLSLGVRGSDGLAFSTLAHDKLQRLTIECGGLPKEVVQELGRADLPSLESLEIWLGTDNYGGNSTIDDVMPLLTGRQFPRLKRLALRDSDISDDIAVAVANAPILSQISVLDLSMGTLGDRGAEALLQSPYLPKLSEINLRHHFMTDPIVAKVKAALGDRVNVEEALEPNTYNGRSYRYVEVGE